jgi:hypothetical protein
MAIDLIEHHMEVGHLRKDVLQLLGSPDESYNWLQAKRRLGYSNEQLGPLTWKVDGYYLGSWSGFRMDEDVLLLLFDRSGRLLDKWLVQY